MDASVEGINSDTFFCIEITKGVQSIKEIYYANGRGSIFSYKQTKTTLITLLIFMALSGLFYLLSFSNQVTWIFLFFVMVGAAVVNLLIFFLKAKKYFEWKKGVTTYLKEVSKYDKETLNLNAHSFELINEGETVIEKWKNIKKASISATHIMLNSESGAHYLFPAKSMKASEYEALNAFIRQKMNAQAAGDSTAA